MTSASGSSGHLHHTIDYVELSVTDLAVATSFYAAAFGWSFNDYGPTYAGIRWSEGDGEVGGLALGPGSGGTGVLVLLYSEHLEASVAAVEAAGGVVVDHPYAFPGGRRFTFTDPSGNRLGVWSAT